MNTSKLLIPLSALTFFAASASATLLLYEGFDYTTAGDSLHGKGTAGELGLSTTDTWLDSTGATGNMYLKSGSLNFSDLNTTGNHIGWQNHLNNDIYNRDLSAGAQGSIDTLGTGNDTLYFSFLFEKLESRNSADREGLALTNGNLASSRFDSGNSGSTGLHGFAVAATDSSNLRLIAYDGSAGTRTVSSFSVSTPSAFGGTNTGSSNNSGFVKMIVGEISFNTGIAGADVFTLYSVADDGALDATDLTNLGSFEANMDESTLSTLSLTRQVNVNYDEVRFGTSMDDVLGIVPEPSVIALISFGGLLLLRRRRS